MPATNLAKALFLVARRDGILDDRGGDGDIAFYRVGAGGKRSRLRLIDLAIVVNPAQRSHFEALARRVGSTGEPWQAFFDPGSLTRDLRAMGFGYVEDNGPEEINTRYFKNRKDGLRVGSLSHLMKAQV